MGAKKLAVMQFAKKFLILIMLVVIFEGLRMVSAQCGTDGECRSQDDCAPGYVCCPWVISRCPDGAGTCARNCA
ncbi:hypothetical protein SUGI_1116230 [Cryptomeria japonica]|nr:hypothetical protein SUGI_1116230 [Cryptomeria japonica]